MKKQSLPQMLVLNAYWVGLSFMWNSLHPIILPAVLLNYVPDAKKNTYLGLLTFLGLILAMVIQPLSGALSDGWKSRFGRRRPLMVLGTWWGGLDGAVLALICSQTLNCFLNFKAVRVEAAKAAIPISLEQARSERAILWKFSLPAVLSGFLVGPVNWVCSTLIVNQPGGYGEMGLFNAASQWRQWP